MMAASMWKCYVCNAANSGQTRSCGACGHRGGQTASGDGGTPARPSASSLLASSPYGGGGRALAEQQSPVLSATSNGGTHQDQLRNPLRSMTFSGLTDDGVGGGSSVASSSPAGGGDGSQRAAAANEASAMEERQLRLHQHQVHSRRLNEMNREHIHRLAEASRQGEASREQIHYLTEVLQRSNQYGKDVEAAIEHLSQLLHRKTVECEGLRTLANENYGPLRTAVRNQYESSVKAETRQQHELRQAQAQIESISQERAAMQKEIASLQVLVKELKDAPPHASYNPSDRSLFNRLTRDDFDVDSVTSWGPTSSVAGPTNATQREVIGLLSSMDEPTAAALDRAGMFDFVKVVANRMCTQLKGMPPGHYPSLADAVASVLRDKHDSNIGLQALANEAQNPVPSVASTDRNRVAQLFLANNPGQYDELQALLTMYAGREAELYQRLKMDYATVEKRADIGAALGASSGAKTLDVGGAQPESQGELFARIMLMYRKYNPAKIGSPDLNAMLNKYPPELIIASLVEKYGPEPSGEERRALIKSISE